MLFWIIGPIVLFRSVYNILVFILNKKNSCGFPIRGKRRLVHAETINPIFYRFRGLKDRFPEIIFRIDPDLIILIFDPADLQDLLKSGLPRFVFFVRINNFGSNLFLYW